MDNPRDCCLTYPILSDLLSVLGRWGIAPAILLLLSSGGPAFAQFEQLTNDAGGAACGSFEASVSSNGLVVAFESTCDLDGDNEDNGDGSREIFVGGRGAALVQITSSPRDCANTAPVVSADGSVVAFESDCDLDGSNPDANVEIWIWKGGDPLALTDTFGCTSLEPAINADGSLVVFDSDCSSSGDFSSEIVLANAGDVDFGDTTQLTDDLTGLCDSLSPDISDDGSLIVFESDCDLTDDNEDLAAEIFSVTPAGIITKLSNAPDDTCAAFEVSLSGDASTAVFQSDCDYSGANGDGGNEIFKIATDSGALTQLTNDDSGALCETARPAVNSDGSFVAFESSCDRTGSNGDESSEIFRVGVGTEQLTDGQECDSMAPAIDASGIEVLFDSNCDLLGTNEDGNAEIFDVFEFQCRCGAPKSKDNGPLASDALFVLKAAVGLDSCMPCECDVNDDGRIASSDALNVLRAAVGQIGVVLECPAPPDS
ncbi:MAG: Tol biopolymer transport system component [Hyphomicrobiaceae bacterium]